MPTLTPEQALENVYTSLHNDNADIDAHILALKAAMAGRASIEVDPSRLVQNNRQGRKMMQSYFRKRGVEVTFAD
jgi:hypothetical protein